MVSPWLSELETVLSLVVRVMETALSHWLSELDIVLSLTVEQEIVSPISWQV
jgi:hypothetical protein